VTHQAVVQAIHDLKREHGFAPGAITRVVVRGPHRILEERHTVRDPRTVMGGQYSLPFTAAVALTRDMSDPRVYDQAAVDDPLVRKLAREMELVLDEHAHEMFEGSVEVTCGSKTCAKQTAPHKGSPHNPLRWDDACEKFTRYTRGLIGEAQAKALMSAIADLENRHDVAELARLLRKS
jgi:2-methylcitrate dehydratase PrpD